MMFLVLYQGTASAVPQSDQKQKGFSPGTLYRGTVVDRPQNLDSLKGHGFSRATSAAEERRL
jgi:hypothetical protein